MRARSTAKPATTTSTDVELPLRIELPTANQARIRTHITTDSIPRLARESGSLIRGTTIGPESIAGRDGTGMITKDRWMVDGVEELERVLPGFDPVRLGRVEALHLDFDREGSLTVRIRAEYWTSTLPEMLLELTFYGARQVIIPVLGTFDLSELEVRDISDRQLEEIQREVVNHGPERFSLLCRQAEMTQLLSRDGDVLTPLWRRNLDN